MKKEICAGTDLTLLAMETLIERRVEVFMRAVKRAPP